MATDQHTGPQGEDPRDELQWLAHQIGEKRVGEFSQTQGDQSRIEWQEFLGECRSELNVGSVDDERRAKPLAQAILDRSVREDLSVVADWRLVGTFVRQRLASSGLLRVVAASLLLHLFALPVMAYYVWVMPEPEPSIQIHMGGEEEVLPYGIIEPEVVQDPAANEQKLEALQDLELLNGLFRAHRVPNTNGESGAAEQILWSDDLGLILRMEMLCARESKGVRSELHRARVRFTFESLEDCLDELREGGDRPFLKRLAASAWLRSRSLRPGAGTGADSLESSLREFECRAWLGSKGPLDGLDWRDACTQAEAELENSAK